MILEAQHTAYAAGEPFYIECRETQQLDNGLYVVFNEAGALSEQQRRREQGKAPLFQPGELDEARLFQCIQGKTFGSQVYGQDHQPIVKPEAFDEDGALAANLDLMRGPNTLYFGRYQADNLDDVATMRKQFPMPGGSYKDAPSYKRCIANAPEAEEHLQRLADAGFEIVEAGALASQLPATPSLAPDGSPRATSQSTYDIFRWALRYSVDASRPQKVADPARPGQFIELRQAKPQAWQIGMVTNTHDRFKRRMGSNLRQIGRESFFDERVNYALRYACIIPEKFIDILCADYLQARHDWKTAQEHQDINPNIWKELAKGLLYFTDGLTQARGHMNNDTWAHQIELRDKKEEWGLAA